MLSMPLPSMSRLYHAVYVICTLLAITALVSSNIVIDRFKCSKSCTSEGAISFYLSNEAIHTLLCAAECSKHSWCAAYIFVKTQNSSSSSLQPASKPCRLYMHESFKCLTTPTSSLTPTMCVKFASDVAGKSQTNGVTHERVLEVVGSKVSFPQGQDSLSTLLAAGNNLRIHFNKRLSQYFTRANFYTLMTYSVSCVSVSDPLSGSDIISSVMTFRYFCSNGSETVYPLTSGKAEKFYWDVENLQDNGTPGWHKVYSQGTGLADLLPAINNGLDIHVLFSNNNKVVHADVVILNRNNNDVAMQTLLHENGQDTLVSHVADGRTVTVTWPSITPTLTSQSSGTLKSVWLSDPSWKFICSTSTAINPIKTLKNILESGRRIRIKMTIGNVDILATPDYIGSDPSGTVTAHVLRVFGQETVVSSSGVIGGLVNTVGSLLGGGQKQVQSQLMWTHYIAASNGTSAVYKTQLGSAECTQTTTTATVEWFEEENDWTLIHTSTSGDVTSQSLLTGKVLTGSHVRIKMEAGGSQSWFTCDMLEVVNHGEDVKCHVKGQVSTTSDPSGISLLGGVLSPKSTASIIRSECFTISAATGATGVVNSCLWQSPVLPGPDSRPKVFHWFVD